MFTTLLGSLTNLLPKNYIFGSVVPTMLFGFINLALLYATSTPFRAFASAQLNSATSAAFVLAVLFAATIIVAYTISAIGDFLRAVLQGEYLWPKFLRLRMIRMKQNALDSLQMKIEETRDARGAIDAKRGEWRKRLVDAGALGTQNHANAKGYQHDPARKLFMALRWKRAAGLPVNAADIEETVVAMCSALATFDKTADKKLQDHMVALVTIIDDVRTNWFSQEVVLTMERDTQYGEMVPAPTRMGNVSASLERYATTRFGIDFDTFWSRLLLVLQKTNAVGYGALVDAKTQLDFLVASCWLCLFTTLLWFVALASLGEAPWLLAAVSILGPFLTYRLYAICVTNYLAYADLARSAIELYRFDLLQALHLALPQGIRQERELWRTLSQISRYGSENIELSYEHSQT